MVGRDQQRRVCVADCARVIRHTESRNAGVANIWIVSHGARGLILYCNAALSNARTCLLESANTADGCDHQAFSRVVATESSCFHRPQAKAEGRGGNGRVPDDEN